LAACNEEFVYIFNPSLYSRDSSRQTKEEMEKWEQQYSIEVKASGSDVKEKFVKWTFENDSHGNKSIRMKFTHIMSQVAWHSKGDYFSTMAHNVQTSSQVMIHSLQRSTSTRPFNQSKGII